MHGGKEVVCEGRGGELFGGELRFLGWGESGLEEGCGLEGWGDFRKEVSGF